MNVFLVLLAVASVSASPMWKYVDEVKDEAEENKKAFALMPGPEVFEETPEQFCRDGGSGSVTLENRKTCEKCRKAIHDEKKCDKMSEDDKKVCDQLDIKDLKCPKEAEKYCGKFYERKNDFRGCVSCYNKIYVDKCEDFHPGYKANCNRRATTAAKINSAYCPVA